MGYFTSFTLFLALNDADFSNRFLRPAAAASSVGVLSLAGYFRFWGAVYAAVTVAVWLFKRESSRQRGVGALCAPTSGGLHVTDLPCPAVTVQDQLSSLLPKRVFCYGNNLSRPSQATPLPNESHTCQVHMTQSHYFSTRGAASKKRTHRRA